MTEPKIRFKCDDGSSFPDWEEKTLGELGCFTKGASLSKADISDDGNPFVLYGELYTTYNEVAYEIKRKTQAVVDKKYYSKVGDVVIPTSGESPEEISTATCIMVPNVILAGDLNIYRSEKIDGRVISYIINHQAKEKIARIAQGKSVVHIQAKQLEKIEVSYPSDEKEQQKIADFLSNVDEVIAASEEEVANLEQQKKAMMQKIFSQEVRFKKEDGSSFPEWEEKRFDELYQKITEKNDLSFGAESIISVANMYFREDTGADALMPDYMKTYNVMRLGDIAFEGNKSKYFKYGRFVENTIGDGIVSHVFDVFRPLKPLNMMFWKTLINYEPVMGKILAKCTKSSTMMTNLDSKAFLKQSVSVPCETEQQLIADFLTSYDEAITAAKQELAKWKELKKGLLQQMFV